MDSTYCKQILQKLSAFQTEVTQQLQEIRDISGQEQPAQEEGLYYSFDQSKGEFSQEIMHFLNTPSHSTPDYLIFFMRMVDHIKTNHADLIGQYQDELQKLATYIQGQEKQLQTLKVQREKEIKQTTAKKEPRQNSTAKKRSASPLETKRAQGQYEKETQRLQKMEKEFTSMNQKFQGLSDYVSQVEEENKELEAQIDSMKKSLAGTKSLSPSRYDKYVQQKQEIKTLMDRLAEKDGQLAEREERIRALENQQRKRTKEMTEQRSRLALLQEQKVQLSQELSYQLQLKGDQDYLKNKWNNEVKQKDSQLNSLRQQHHTEMTTLKRNKQEVELRLKMVQQEKEEAKEQEHILKENLREIEAQLLLSQKEGQAKTTQLTQAQQEIGRMKQSQLIQEQEESKQHKATTQELQQNIASLMDYLSDKEKEIQKLKEQLARKNQLYMSSVKRALSPPLSPN